MPFLFLRIARFGGAGLLLLSLLLPWFRVPIGVKERIVAKATAEIYVAITHEAESTSVFRLVVLATFLAALWIGYWRRRTNPFGWAKPMAVSGSILFGIILIAYPAVTTQRCAAISAHAAWLQMQHDSLIWLGGDAFSIQEYANQPGEPDVDVKDLPRAFVVLPTPPSAISELRLAKLPEVLMWLGWPSRFHIRNRRIYGLIHGCPFCIGLMPRHSLGKSLAWRLVPTGVFEKPFRGNRIRWVQNGDTSWVEQDLILPENPFAGSLRVATDTPFQIWINGRLVQPTTRYHGALSPGPWFIKETGRNALEVLTEILNPDEVATLLPGQRYEKPRHGDPTANNFRPYDYTFNGTPDRTISTDDPFIGHGTPYEYSFTATSDRIVPTDNDTLSPGVPAKTNGRESDKYSSIEKPAAVVPITLTRDRRTVEFAAYSVTPLLQKGKNPSRLH